MATEINLNALEKKFFNALCGFDFDEESLKFPHEGLKTKMSFFEYYEEEIDESKKAAKLCSNQEIEQLKAEIPVLKGTETAQQ